MSFAILTLVAILQLVFVVFLLVTLVLGRVLSEWRTAIDDARTDQLMRAATEWLSGRSGAHTFIADVERARYGSVVAVLQRIGHHLGGEAWEGLVVSVRGTAWFEELEGRASSPFWWRRLSATSGYAMVALPDDAPILERLIRDRNSVVRLAAVTTIRRVLLDSTLEAVLDLADTKQSTVRKYVLETLTASRGLDLQLVQQRLDQAVEPRQLRTLLDLVTELGIPSFLDHVLPHATHPDLEVRIAVARALAEFPHPSSAASLGDLLADTAWQARAQAAAALGSIGAKEALPALRLALEDPSWWVRLRAGLALRRLGSDGVTALDRVRREDDRYAYDMARYVLALDYAAVAEYAGSSAVDYTDAARHSLAA